MLFYLAGMEPYYLICIKDGPFQPKTAEGDAKPESQWTSDERRVVIQDQRLKSIIMSCLPDDIMESVISCVSAKERWTDLVHNFIGPLYTKENRIMDLKLEYQTFRTKSTETLSHTYTRYKTLLNELENDDVNLSKHEINVGFVNSLPEKWLTFSQGLRNANHTQTVDLADIYGRFVYEDNLIQRSKEYLRDLDIKYHERALLANSKRFIKRRNDFSSQKANENTECYKCGNKGHFARDCFSKTSEPFYKSPVNNYSSVSKGFQPKFTPQLIQSSSNSNNQANTKFQKDYKAEYNKMKAKLALFEDEEEVFDEEEVTQVKVLMALADDELTVGKSHARNAKLDATTFQIQNTELTKLNHVLQEQLKEDKKINEKWLTSSKKVSQYISEQIPHQKKKVLGGELLTESSSKGNENENLFVPASMGYDQEMVLKTKDWVEKLNPDSKLPNFNTGRILVPESQAVNESLEPTKTLNTPESSKDSDAESLTPLPPLKNLQGASLTKVKPFPPCTQCGFNDHRPDDYRNYPECKICRSYDHSTLGHNHVIQIRGGVLAESSQSNESSIVVKCNTCGSTVHSTSDHNEFDHFKRGEKIQAAKARKPTKKWVHKRN
ncbi:retrovirus-related pol polyprotein from transposon TNT 1-94 [Tanacetum coccineum]